VRHKAFLGPRIQADSRAASLKYEHHEAGLAASGPSAHWRWPVPLAGSGACATCCSRHCAPLRPVQSLGAAPDVADLAAAIERESKRGRVARDLSRVVNAWECDVVEHFTIAYYFDRFADSSRNLLELIGKAKR